eukprot:443115_1
MEVADLRQHIKAIRILNADTEGSTLSSNQLISNENVDTTSFIISDVDEELIVLIEFKQMVRLCSLKIYSLSILSDDIEHDTSPPKQIHIYNIDNLSKDFDDLMSMKSHKSIECTPKKLNKGQFINLKKNSTKFHKSRCLAIYITSNQNETE